MKPLARTLTALVLLGLTAGALDAAVAADTPGAAKAPIYSWSVADDELGKVKTPGVLPALKFGPYDFADEGLVLMGLDTLVQPGAAKRPLAESATFRSPKGLSVEAARLASAEEAQKSIKNSLAMQGSGYLKRILAGPLADVGDLRAAGILKGQEEDEQLSAWSIQFTRNNVLVHVSGKPEDPKAVQALARRVDKMILGWVEAQKDAAPKGAPAAAGAAYSRSIEDKELGKVKTPGAVAALRFTPKDFAEFGQPTTVSEEDKWKDDLTYRTAKGLKIWVGRMASAKEIHVSLKSKVDDQSAGAIHRVLAGPLADLGDICLVAVSDSGDPAEQLSTRHIEFCRNNVWVYLTCEQADVKALAPLALRIDKQILAWVQPPKDVKPPAAPAGADKADK